MDGINNKIIDDNSKSQNTNKKTKNMTEYRVGDSISGYKLKKIYFVNNEKKFIIAKVEGVEVKVFGETPVEIIDLLGECKFLTNELIKKQSNREIFEYQRALAINTYLVGEKEESKKILEKLLSKLQEKNVIMKKFYYVGVYLFIIVLMILISILGSNIGFLEQYMKYIKIATFGSFGGFIALNIKLKEVKFEVMESTGIYIIMSIYKLVFAMISSIVSYFFIESDIILGILKNNTSNHMYLIYTIATLAGFSESLLPNVFKNIEKEAYNNEENSKK